MLLLTHILIALSSIAFTTLLFFYPSKRKFQVNYALVAATIGSGTVLVVSTGAHMLQACLTGLFYVGAIALGTAAAHRRWALSVRKNNE